ncbi:hypothetical protein D557_1933 [Bordetella holmesii 70147]|nr:hypothetical protein D557_1933 [Bordetella holmesii 70147]
MVLDDWRELKRLGDERIARVRALEGFYVLWPRYCSAWTQHLHEVAQGSTYRADPRFLGFCEVGEKPTLPNAMIPVPPSQDGAISMMEYLRRHSRNPRIGLMCFPGTHGEWALWRGVQGQFDYLAHMAASGAAHTYVPVEQERDHYLREIDSYLAMMAGMDLLSQQTLAARIHAYLALDRGPLLRYMISADYQYFNGASPQCSFVPREQEIYVDVGASQGECLGRMAGLVGPGSELWGWSPTVWISSVCAACHGCCPSVPSGSLPAPTMVAAWSSTRTLITRMGRASCFLRIPCSGAKIVKSG